MFIEVATMKPQPLIAVRDVEASSAWYQRLLGCQSGHGGREYEQLVRDGKLLMQLHHWGDHDHPNLGDSNAAPPGHGVLLWFETDDFDGAVANARAWRTHHHRAACEPERPSPGNLDRRSRRVCCRIC
jgi:hypothetical protein